MPVQPEDTHSATTELSGFAFSALSSMYASISGEYDLEILDHTSERFAVKTDYGTYTLEPLGSGTRVAVSAESAVNLHVLKDGFVLAISHVSTEVAEAVRWSDTTQEGSLPPNFQFGELLEITQVCRTFKRLRLAVPDLKAFNDEALHFRILRPPETDAPIDWPRLKKNGSVAWPKGDAKLHMPVYTARHVHHAQGLLDIDIFEHEGGQITEWLRRAKKGEQVAVMGPGGGSIPQADRVHLFGDETAFPAIARILEACEDQIEGSVHLLGTSTEVDYPMSPPKRFDVMTYTAEEEARFCNRALDCSAKADGAFIWFAAEKALAQEVRACLKARKAAAGTYYAVSYWEKDPAVSA